MKQFNGIDVLAPGIFPEQTFDEAKVLGLMTWIWCQDVKRSETSIKRMIRVTLPAIKTKQFILFSYENSVLGYVSYAHFSAQMEASYCYGDLDHLYNPENWLSGDRLWIINWFAPFGHHWKLMQIVKEHLFSSLIGRFLKATKVPRELILLSCRGNNVSREQQLKWQAAHPILPYSPNTQPQNE